MTKCGRVNVSSAGELENQTLELVRRGRGLALRSSQLTFAKEMRRLNTRQHDAGAAKRFES